MSHEALSILREIGITFSVGSIGLFSLVSKCTKPKIRIELISNWLEINFGTRFCSNFVRNFFDMPIF